MDILKNEVCPKICAHLPEYVFLLSPDFEILWANEAFCQAVGFVPQEIKGKYCYQLVHGQPHPPPGCPALKALRTKSPAENAMLSECLNQEFLVKVTPVTSKDGKIDCLWHLAISTTHLVNFAKSLFRTQKCEIVGKLCLGVMHDLKNILTFFNGQIELLNLTISEDRVKRRLEKMKSIVEKMANLSEKLCRLGNFNPQHANYIEVNKTLKSLESLFEILLPKSIELSISFSPQESSIYIDLVTFEQIILNLVLNAVDALNGKGKINIYTLRERDNQRDYVKIIVEDNGPGMSKSLIDRIFMPFFTTKESGTGLGLSMVKQYMEDVGGDIRVLSKEGEGTRFELIFPLAKPSILDV